MAEPNNDRFAVVTCPECEHVGLAEVPADDRDPTPETFERLAEWWEASGLPRRANVGGGEDYAPAYMLRLVAEAYREAQETSDE